MERVYPYIIKHVFLNEKLQEDILLPNDNSGLYLVFWWHQIPIGDLFCEGKNHSPRVPSRQNILKAISSNIDCYVKKQHLETDFQSAFLNGRHDLFEKSMNEVFQNYKNYEIIKEVEISVIVCTRNRPDYLQQCLHSLLKQISIPKEIIVVDNAPSDNQTEELVKIFEKVSYFRENRAGLDIARNTGAQLAQYSIVAYIDDDVEIHPLWTNQIWKSFQEKNIDVVTGLTMPASLDTESQHIFEKYWGFNKGFYEILYDSKFITRSVPRVWDIGAGVNMAFRKAILENVGYFDERLDVGAAGCNGDSEIWFRILSAGGRILYNPRAVLYHKHRKDLDSLRKQLFSYTKGHVVAALFQHDQDNTIGYKKYVFRDLSKYYLLLIRLGFPFYKFRYQTLWKEIKGIFSGISFYYKNRHTPRILQPKNR